MTDAAELLVEDVPIFLAVEVLLAAGGRDVLPRARAVDRVACLVERVFVHVRSVDLHPLRKGFGPMASASSMAIE